ncbi:MAG: aminomethyltransferase beta-barrel domain-containing protein, partial [Clostridium sp.]
TLGQRKGLGIGGAGEAWFVVSKDLGTNILYVVQGEENPLLFTYGLIAKDINWVSGSASSSEFDCTAKFRYRQPDQKIRVKMISDDSALVIFNDPQRAITPGQAVVFYNEDVCLGGGFIDSYFKTGDELDSYIKNN